MTWADVHGAWTLIKVALLVYWLRAGWLWLRHR
jgi:hypothetical protein